jgi:peptide/nickel transport system substrate-binding protein
MTGDHAMSITFDRRGLLRAAAIAGTAPFYLGRAQAQPRGTLRFGLSSYPPSIRPWENTGTAAATVKLLIYRGLLGYDSQGNVRAELAQSFDRDGERAYVFKLRPNVRFANGAVLTSDDVRFTVEQITGERSTAFFRADFQNLIERVETPDPLTARIVLKEPSATLPYMLASPHAPIISRASMAANANAPAGHGPFLLGASERGAWLELAANPNFHRPGLPKLAGVRMIAYADENLRVAALEAGDVDIIEYVPWQNFDSIGANPRLVLDAVDGPFMFLIFNGTKPPFNDRRLRQAVAFAVKREDIVKAAFFGKGSVLGGIPIPRNSPFFNEENSRFWTYDPDRARRLMAEAGVGGGFSCVLLSTAQYGMHKDTAEVVREGLAGVGISVEMRLPDWATRITMGNRAQYDVAVMGSTGDFNDPDGLNSLMNGSLPTAFMRSVGVRSETVEGLLAEGRRTLDPEKRKQIYARMERAALEEAMLVGLAWRSQGYAMRRGITGFRNLPGFVTFFSGTTLEETAIG